VNKLFFRYGTPQVLQDAPGEICFTVSNKLDSCSEDDSLSEIDLHTKVSEDEKQRSSKVILIRHAKSVAQVKRQEAKKERREAGKHDQVGIEYQVSLLCLLVFGSISNGVQIFQTWLTCFEDIRGEQEKAGTQNGLAHSRWVFEEFRQVQTSLGECKRV
jgi:hypothetical protein